MRNRLFKSNMNFSLSIKRFLGTALVCLFHFFPPDISASVPEKLGTGMLELDGSRERFYAGLFGEYLEDRSRSLTLEQVSSPGFDKKFQPMESRIKNIGYTDSAYWVRFTVVNRDPEKTEWWLNVLPLWTDNINIYFFHNNGILRRKGGIHYPFYQREVKVNDFIFPLSLAEGESVMIYSRVSSRSLQLNFSFWQPEKYMETYYFYQLLNGFSFGLLLVMAVYNLMIFLSLRDKSYLYYTVYLVSMGLSLFSMTGYGFTYLWPDLTGIGISISRIFASIYLIVAILQAMNLLEVREQFPFSYRVMQFLIIAPVAVIVLFLFPQIRDTSQLLIFSTVNTGIIIFTIFFVSCRSFLRGFPPARYFTLAWIFLFLGVLIFVMKQFAILPGNFFTQYSIHSGIALEVLFISLALTDRIRLLRREKETAQLEALESQRILTEELERKVTVRSDELKQSEERFRGLSDATFEGILVCRRGKIIDCNSSFLDLSGYTAGEVSGKRLVNFFLADKSYPLKEILKFDSDYPVELLMKKRRGNYIPVEMLGKKIMQSGKKILMIALRDIRERKKNQRMRNSIERMIRHDLKAPLSSIIDFSKRLMEQGSDKKLKKSSKIISENSLRMAEMLNQSADLFEMEKGTYAVSPEQFDLVTLLRRISREFRSLKNTLRVTLGIYLNGEKISSGGTYPIEGEEKKLHNLFANLIKNAIEASPPGKPVSVSISRQKGYHCIDIHNSGEIPDKIKTRFFDPYVTFGKTGGMGLGTYSARTIAVSHKGDIYLSSTGKEGTHIVVKLPCE